MTLADALRKVAQARSDLRMWAEDKAVLKPSLDAALGRDDAASAVISRAWDEACRGFARSAEVYANACEVLAMHESGEAGT